MIVVVSTGAGAHAQRADEIETFSPVLPSLNK
jgi:hypothetical protein